MKDKIDYNDEATKYWLFLKKIGIDTGMTLEEFKKSGFCEGLEDWFSKLCADIVEESN